jgi:GTP-binding protein HflX
MEIESGDGARALLVGIERKGGWTMRDSLEELGRLAATDGLTVAGSVSQKLLRPHPSTYIGSGKVGEIREALLMLEARFLVFDDELSASQHRNLEKLLGDDVRIVDRTGLILDIFNRHAHSREGKLQVELAHLKYLLPRLSGLKADLAQQVGGSGAGLTGLRGPGETQLELDRRRMRKRIQKLSRELRDVRVHRDQGRRQRERAGVPVVSIVGYTNAGKSSLLNALTGAGVPVEDKLFATLDPTTRRLRLPGGREVLLTDTVGFIRKLPHELIASFRATLEGIEEAALLLHVVDASHPRASEMIGTVESVLSELKAMRARHLVVWNKIDALRGGGGALVLPQSGHRSVAVSARTGENLPALLSAIEETLAESLTLLEAVVPYGRYDLVSAAYAQGTVESREETAEGVRLRLWAPEPLARRLSKFAVTLPAKGRRRSGPLDSAGRHGPLVHGDASEAQAAEVAPGPQPGEGEAEEVAETH